MSDDFLVQPLSLRTDAKKWDEWKAQLTKISDTVPMLGAGLDPLAFSILPGGPDVAKAYGLVSARLTSSLKDGTDQFAGFSNKLTVVAEHYDSAEQLNLDDIAKTSSELDAH